MALRVVPQGAANPKRKHDDESDTPGAAKKLRSDDTPPHLASASLHPLTGIIADLQPKYEVKTLSVLSSTSIAKRVDAILQHLGRFHPWDPAVLPGVVLLYARASAANKLITVAETVRRRIHEGDQKWYQYNRLYEMDWAAKQNDRAPGHDKSVVEDTLIGTDGKATDDRGGDEDEGEDEDEEYFETMGANAATPTQFERAVHGEPKARRMAHLSVFLSRLPVPELRARDNFTVQSNEEHINYVRKKKAGLA